jgi:hypothetical protein
MGRSRHCRGSLGQAYVVPRTEASARQVLPRASWKARSRVLRTRGARPGSSPRHTKFLKESARSPISLGGCKTANLEFSASVPDRPNHKLH